MIAAPTKEASAAFAIGELEVLVRSDLRGVLDDFAALYPECRRTTSDADAVICMDVRQDGRTVLGRKRYAVHGDGEKIHRHLHPDEVLPHLEWGISWRIVARCNEYLQVHAASMAHGDKGVVLAGGSGAGKSTLAAALLARGWKYFCDEFALIDPETLLLHAYPKAVCVKAGAFDMIKSLGMRLARDRHYIKALKGKVGYISPAEFGPETVAEPCPIRYVIFPKYTGQTEARLYPLPRARAAFALMQCALNRDVFEKDAVSLAGRIVRGAECFGLETGPIDETCDLLESLVDQTPC
jgi:HprK-related kinase A